MAYTIYRAISTAYKKNGLAAAQQKYRNYFIKKDIYDEWQETVDMMLIADGLEGCIVEA